MYLKKIEIQGFKTFADHTLIEFMGGANITAVVGPNGCGKSNFLEAVRWGMGEQSVKMLRSSSSTEVIFSGSKDRKATSLAEVQITIDNSSKILPLDFNEVTLRRRLYRSGESEYFLNKTPCRLRDINDLFMDTGVGKNSYSIIGQGQIDVLINMKPEEKKMMFEEAAGINKYKHRKEQARRKLVSTTEHLSRITDLKTEICSQITTLEQQAKEAQTYLALKEELKSIELSTYKSKILAWQKQKTELDKIIATLRNEILTITEQSSLNDEHKNRQRQRLAQIEGRVSQLQQDRELLNKEIETINTALLVNAERTQNQHQRLEQLAEEKGALEATCKMIESQLKEAQAELALDEASQKQVNQDIENEEKANTKARSTLRDLQNQQGQARESLNADTSRLNLLEELQKTHEGYFQGVRAILEAKDESTKFKGILGVVADLIDTDNKYETAIETALAAHVQDIVTDNEETAKQSIIYLRENGFGRATFLPLNLIKERNSSHFQNQDKQQSSGIIGIASDLVTFKPQFEPIIEHLLGNVLIAEDMDAALNVVRKNRGGQINRIVTLKGEIIMMSGAMTGGSSSKKSVPLLGRPRLILELKKKNEITLDKIATLTEEVQKLIQENEKLNDQLILNKVKSGQLSEHILQAKVKIQTLKAAQTEHQEKIEAKLAEQDIAKERIEETEQNIAEKEKQLPVLGKQVTEYLTEEHALISEKQVIQKELDDIEDKAKDSLFADRDLRDKLGHSEIQMARLESDVSMVEDRLLSEYDSTIEDVLKIDVEPSTQGQDERVEKLKRRIKSMEPVNVLAIEEFSKQSERQSFIDTQFQDLQSAIENLNKLIRELDQLARKDFLETLAKIQENFQITFSKLFEGGEAEIKLLDDQNVLESGVEIFVNLPRKKPQAMSLLSGGEKALTAVALIFALLKTKPAPFCFLDEVDAALDEANIRRFSEMLSTFSLDSQMIVITHNKQTITAADAIYGITMQESGVSKVVSVKMEK